jgi:hypothetical protein
MIFFIHKLEHKQLQQATARSRTLCRMPDQQNSDCGGQPKPKTSGA